MNRFTARLLDFMRGRYGYDELARFLGVLVIVLIIVSILLGVVARLLLGLGHLYTPAAALNLLATLANWASIIALVWMFFRVLSRNHGKRRAENERFLRFRARRGKGGAASGASSRSSQSISRDAAYDYLNCPFCGQRMRVPHGKGKLAVKCPSCGQKTIYNS